MGYFHIGHQTLIQHETPPLQFLQNILRKNLPILWHETSNVFEG